MLLIHLVWMTLATLVLLSMMMSMMDQGDRVRPRTVINRK
jgi:hypothetical protein